MAEMKVEHTAEGKDIRYTVHVHPEAFRWFTTEELIVALMRQFKTYLTDALYEMSEEAE